MKKYILIFVVVLLSTITTRSQDFRCTFSVTSNVTDGNVDRMKYNEMQKQIQDFINSYKWCNYNIGYEERIEVTMQLVISEVLSADQFKGRFNIGLRRPVYNSTYTTTLFNYVDEDIEFVFTEGEPIVYNEGSFDSNLSSLIAFYMNMFLGLYFDSFGQNAGSVYYDKAQNVVNAAQSAKEKGWRSFENRQRNRYWIAENMVNPSYKGIRNYLYLYHLKGMDYMTENESMAISYITQALEQLRAANRQKPGLFMVIVMLEAKREELINIYRNANDNEKNKFIAVMTEIDPANLSKYNQIKNQ